MTVVPLHPHTIGGSEAGAACGVDPHRSRVMLFLEKTGRAERAETEAMRWGTRLQDDVLDALTELGYAATAAHDLAAMPNRTMGGAVVDPDCPWRIGHPDGLVWLDGAECLLEIKTVGQWAHAANGGAVPLAYACQVQHYLHLTGLERCLLAVLVGGQRLELLELARDAGVIRRMLALEEEFYGYLCRDECPPVGPSDREALALMYPAAAEGRKMRLDKEAMGWLRELQARRAVEDAVAEQRAELENRLKAVMGDAEIALAPNDDEVIRWRNFPSVRTDVKGLRAAHPQIAGWFVTTTQTRRFTLL